MLKLTNQKCLCYNKAHQFLKERKKIGTINPDPQPYNNWGNGSAMRISAVAYVAKTLEEVKLLSRKVTAVTHNHPEGNIQQR